MSQSSDEAFAIWQGSFMIGGLEMKCYILNDGRRIIDAESMEKFFSGDFSGVAPSEAEHDSFVKWCKGR